MKNTKRTIRSDCLRYMKEVCLAHFCSELAAILVPTFAAAIVGTMADYLLQADFVAAKALAPRFLVIMVLSVLTVPLCTLALYKNMTTKGYDYDVSIVRRFMSMRTRDIQEKDIGEITERIEGTLGDFSWNTVYLFSLPFVIIVYAIIVIAFVFSNDVPITFVLLVMVCSVLPIVKTKLIVKKQVEHERLSIEFDEKRKTEEMSIPGIKDFLYVCNASAYKTDALRKIYDGYMKRDGKKKMLFESRSAAADSIIRYIIPLIILVVGGRFAQADKVSTGLIVTAYLFLPCVEGCYSYVAKYIEELHAASIYYDRLAFFYGEQEPSGVLDKAEANAIIADNISFAYSANQEGAVNEVTFEANISDCIMFMGPNGCGKSTLGSLLSGIQPVTSGEIRTKSGLTLNVNDLRRLVSIQEQKGALFSGTIRENLFVRDEQADLAQEYMNEFGLGKNLDYFVEPEGANLSPGEKKKILLIRAVMKDAPFYIFDEPFNHLDGKGKRALENYIATSIARKGIMIISHSEISDEDVLINKRYPMRDGRMLN